MCPPAGPTEWHPFYVCPNCATKFAEESLPQLLRECGHNICGKCCNLLVENGSVKCPVCSEVSQQPSMNAPLHSTLQEFEVVPRLQCVIENCKNTATRKCKKCSSKERPQYLCSTNCFDEAHKYTDHDGHELIAWDQPSDSELFCQNHKYNSLNKMCTDPNCKEAIVCDCCPEHAAHKLVHVTDVSDKTMTKLQQTSEDLKNEEAFTASAYGKAVGVLQKAQQEGENESDALREMKALVEQTYRQPEEELRRSKEALLARVEELCEEQVARAAQETEALATHLATVAKRRIALESDAKADDVRKAHAVQRECAAGPLRCPHQKATGVLRVEGAEELGTKIAALVREVRIVPVWRPYVEAVSRGGS
eukprot:TRINITY_DN17366_c0_g1_i1.p1 TRINITY_DN17366_c0_g1~~TRINITY_DN17366_c0_g1_i1.p1  ORF type:complete len:381 (+),score=91.45 TRINITY_DN17366_c0_g1_i1:49-1143(+)